MPRITELAQRWTLTSTGGGKAVRAAPEASLFSVYFTTSSGCTATVSLQTCAESSAGPWVDLSASTAMSTGATLIQQFTGPLVWLRPYVPAIKASTDVVTVYVIAN
jgi:hypothetical protein